MSLVSGDCNPATFDMHFYSPICFCIPLFIHMHARTCKLPEQCECFERVEQKMRTLREKCNILNAIRGHIASVHSRIVRVLEVEREIKEKTRDYII
jgi:hypothetical protein